MSDPQVLLVEDDHFVAEVLIDLIKLYGCGVEWTDRAQPALDRLHQGFIPDLILSDIRMPGKSGIDLLLEVGRDFPHLTIILMTGFAAEFERLPEADQRKVLLKPIDRRSLFNTLDTALAGKSKRPR